MSDEDQWLAKADHVEPSAKAESAPRERLPWTAPRLSRLSIDNTLGTHTHSVGQPSYQAS